MQGIEHNQIMLEESHIADCSPYVEDKIHVLHVDDELAFLKIVKNYVENYEPRIHIDSMNNPKRALQILRYNNYDCVVSDYQMPEMSGLIFAQKVREISRIPFIFYTGQGSEELAEKAFENGLDDYIKKETGSSHYRLLAKRITTVVYKDRAENELIIKAQARDVYETLVEMAPEGIITLDMDGFVRSSNQAFKTLTGFDKCEIIGKHFLQLGTFRPEYQNKFQDIFQGLEDNKVYPPFEFRYNRKDGSVGWAHATYKVLTYDSERSLLIVNKDITREKLDELKLNVIGRISRHDIRNKLAIIMGYQEIARMKLKKGKDIYEFLDGIRNNCNNILNILNLSKDFQGIGVEKIKSVDVENCFKQATEFFNLSNVNLNIECQGVTVKADSLLVKVFYYLIDHSLKYNDKLSKISLYADHGKIVYMDDGRAFSEDKKKLLFEDNVEIMGLNGLTLIRKIVDSYGWILSEESLSSEGVKFVFKVNMK